MERDRINRLWLIFGNICKYLHQRCIYQTLKITYQTIFPVRQVLVRAIFIVMMLSMLVLMKRCMADAIVCPQEKPNQSIRQGFPEQTAMFPKQLHLCKDKYFCRFFKKIIDHNISLWSIIVLFRSRFFCVFSLFSQSAFFVFGFLFLQFFFLLDFKDFLLLFYLNF